MANVFTNELTSSVGTSDTVVYTPGAGTSYSTVIGITVANIITSNIAVDIYVKDLDTTDVYLLKNTTVEPGSGLVPVGGEQKLVMLPGQELYVVSDTASSADVTVSVLEIS